MKLLQILTILVIVTRSYSESLEDCDKKFPKCRTTQNVVCENYPCAPRGGNECKMDEHGGNYLEFRQAMLELHNDVRELVAGATNEELKGYGHTGAANMLAVSYNLKLEYTAMCHVHGCEMKHDKCRGFDQDVSVGQNLAMKGGSAKKNYTKQDYYDLGHMWYTAEYKADLTAAIDSFNSGKSGHFTQMIWAKTDRIGCATAIKESDSSKAYYLTCNYAGSDKIGGNMLAAPIYIKGTPASQCPNGVKNDKYPNLCGTIDHTDEVNGPNPLYSGNLRKTVGNYYIIGLLLIVIVIFH